MSKTPKQAEMVRRAINAESTEELESLYDDWAETYDDYLEGISYVAPAIGAQLLADHLHNTNSKILDVGCGTGLVGIELVKRQFSLMDGVDLSEGMLALAKETSNYQLLCQGDINQTFPEALSDYDASISIGILGIHVGINALNEMVRLTRSGGVCVISVRTPYYEPSGYKSHIYELVKEQKIELLQEVEKPYILDEGAKAMYIVMKRS